MNSLNGVMKKLKNEVQEGAVISAILVTVVFWALGIIFSVATDDGSKHNFTGVESFMMVIVAAYMIYMPGKFGANMYWIIKSVKYAYLYRVD